MHVTRHYLAVADLLVHYRKGGRGPAVVMLHASPMSSASLLPLMLVLGERFTCYAVDTPGYGLSDPLDTKPRDLRPYVSWLRQVLDALRLRRVLLFGQATGAQIAIEYAKTYPEQVAALVMDSAAVFTAQEIRDWLPRYLPPFRRRADGSHLISAWAMVRDMTDFFPWMMRDAAHRLTRPVPGPGQLHAALLDLLRAGAAYRVAYAAAFRNEVEGVFDGVKVPVTVIVWDQSIIRSYSDRVVSSARTCRVVHVVGDTAAKFAAILQILTTDASGVPPAPVVDSDQLTLTRGFLNSSIGAVHFRVLGQRDGRPLIYFHAPLGSSALVAGAVRPLAKRYRVIVPDLAGHGETDIPLDASLQNFEAQQSPIIESVADMLSGQRTVVCAGNGSNGIALSLAGRSRTATYCRLTEDGAPHPDPVTAVDGAGCLDIVPRIDGSHVLAAWNFVRDSELFSPWHCREPAHARSSFNLSPLHLHARTVELLKVRGSPAMPADTCRVLTGE